MSGQPDLAVRPSHLLPFSVPALPAVQLFGSPCRGSASWANTFESSSKRPSLLAATRVSPSPHSSTDHPQPSATPSRAHAEQRNTNLNMERILADLKAVQAENEQVKQQIKRMLA